MIGTITLVGLSVTVVRAFQKRRGVPFWLGCSTLTGGLLAIGIVIVPPLIDRAGWRTFDPAVWAAAASRTGTPTTRHRMAMDLVHRGRLYGEAGLDLSLLGPDDALPNSLEDYAFGPVYGWRLDDRNHEWLVIGMDSDGFWVAHSGVEKVP